MHRLAGVPIAIIAFACVTAPAPTRVPPPAPAARGLSIDEEARLLRLEDRREFDEALADGGPELVTHCANCLSAPTKSAGDEHLRFQDESEWG